jgi:hypothetical protein
MAMSYQIPSATRASGSNSTRFVNSLQLEREEQATSSVTVPQSTIREGRDSALETQAPLPSEAPSLLELIELMLKNPARLNALMRADWLQAAIVPRLLAVALAGFTAFGLFIGMLLSASGVWPELNAIADYLNGYPSRLFHYREIAGLRVTPWMNGSVLQLVAAYDFGLLAAIGVCLPSFYFYGLLAGVRASMLDVVVHALKAQAMTAVALIGIVPIYAALVMGLLVLQAEQSLMERVLNIGLILPFIAGLIGVWSLYAGFIGLADTMKADRRGRRERFLRRLLVSWCVCYTAVSPVMIHTVWHHLAKR